MPQIERNLQVEANADDCWSYRAWGFLNGGDNPFIGVGYSTTGDRHAGCGLRFALTVPKDAVIDEAYLKITAYEYGGEGLSGDTINSRIAAEDADNPSNFSSDDNDAFYYRWTTRTTAEIDWDAIPAWTVDTEYQSPDIKSVIQEIVNRAGWISGNAIVILWTDFAERTTEGATIFRLGYSHPISNAKAAKLYVKFSATGNIPGDSKEYPVDDVARASSIRHIWQPGFFRMQVGLGDLGFDIDVAEATVRRALDTAKEIEEAPPEPTVTRPPAPTAAPPPTPAPPSPGGGRGRIPSYMGGVPAPTPSAVPAPEPGELTERTKRIMETAAARAMEVRIAGLRAGVEAVVTPYAIDVLRQREREAKLLTEIQRLTKAAAVPGITSYARQVLVKRVIELRQSLEAAYKRRRVSAGEQWGYT